MIQIIENILKEMGNTTKTKVTYEHEGHQIIGAKIRDGIRIEIKRRNNGIREVTEDELNG